MSKFDAAIKIIGAARDRRKSYGLDKVTDLDSAIRVLEAAGKVDKVAALIAVDDSHADYDCINEPTALERTGVRDFIYALPDKED